VGGTVNGNAWDISVAIATAGDVGTPTYATVSTVGGGPYVQQILVYSGRLNTSIAAAFSNSASTAASSNITTSSTTYNMTGVTALSNDDICVINIIDVGGGGVGQTFATSLTGYGDALATRDTTGALYPGINSLDKLNVSPGATGTLAVAASLTGGTANNWFIGGFVISLPAASSVLVSSHGGSYTGTSTTYALTEFAPTNDLIIVQWALNNVASAITPTISDSVNTGNYTQIGSTYYRASASQSWGQHYMPCNAGGTPTITINGGGSSNNGQYIISHYTGFALTPILDANPAPVTGTGTSFSNSITTAYAPEVAISNTFSDTTIASTPSGWTNTGSGGNGKLDQTYYSYQTSASTYNINVSLSASAFYYNWTFSFYSGVVGLSIPAANGTFTLNGQSVSFRQDQLIPFVMLANPGPFDWIGAQAQIQANIFSNTGSLTMTGVGITFYNSTGQIFTLPAASGTFTMTGENAVLQTPTYVAPEFTGVYTMTGFDATLIPIGTPSNFETLPNLVGLDWLTASAVLWYGGFAEISPQVVKGSPIQMQEGIVVGQTPKAYSQVPAGCAVQLSVASSNLLSVSFESH